MFKCFDYTPNAQLPRTEGERAQKVIESAAKLYRPEKYDGKTVLLLASDRPPHLDFHTGWQELVPHNLETQYLDAHHSELVQAPIVLGSECTSGLRGMFWRDAGWRPPGAAETNVYGVGAIILGV